MIYFLFEFDAMNNIGVALCLSICFDTLIEKQGGCVVFRNPSEKEGALSHILAGYSALSEGTAKSKNKFKDLTEKVKQKWHHIRVL